MDHVVLVEELLAVLWSSVAGARYGVKIRLPHAVIMNLVFRRGESFQTRLRNVWLLTYQHAKNLALFAAIYKTGLLVLKQLSQRMGPEVASKSAGRFLMRLLLLGDDPPKDQLGPTTSTMHLTPGRPALSRHAWMAGTVGGYLVWGNYSSLNYQVVLYLTSRVLVALYKRQTDTRYYRLGAALVWGLVMYLFEDSPQLLHPSLKASMDEIYRPDNNNNKG